MNPLLSLATTQSRVFEMRYVAPTGGCVEPSSYGYYSDAMVTLG